jgi:hypothetical protein
MIPKFDSFAAALNSAIDFCQDPDIDFYSASLLQPIATLYSIVYYLAKQKNYSVPDDQRQPLRTVLYFLLFNRFVRGQSPQPRVRWLRDKLATVEQGPVPVEAILSLIQEKQKEYFITTSAKMLNEHPKLALNIVQRRACREGLSWQVQAEVDHVFPQSRYRERHPQLVDDIGNLAYLGKLRNIRKTDGPPWEYFKNIGDEALDDEFLIERRLLSDERFPEFIQVRRQRIEDEVRLFLGR